MNRISTIHVPSSLYSKRNFNFELAPRFSPQQNTQRYSSTCKCEASYLLRIFSLLLRMCGTSNVSLPWVLSALIAPSWRLELEATGRCSSSIHKNISICSLEASAYKCVYTPCTLLPLHRRPATACDNLNTVRPSCLSARIRMNRYASIELDDT